MSRSISKDVISRLVVVMVGIAVSATGALAQVEQHSQISIQGTALVTKSSNDQIPSNEASGLGRFV